MNTFCPECGFGVKVDVDGCCLYCGSVATGPAVDELYSLKNVAQAIRKEKIFGLLTEFRHKDTGEE